MKKTEFKQIYGWVLLGILALLSAACSKSDDDKMAILPAFEVECSIDEVADCTPIQKGKTVFVGITLEDSLSSSISCEDRFLMVPGQFMVQSFDYSAAAPLEDQGTYLLAVARNWRGYNYAPQINFTRDRYQVCAFIDFNNNGELDTFEPFHESQFNGGNADYSRITNWEIF